MSVDLYACIERVSQEDHVSDFHLTEGDPVWVRRNGELQRLDGESGKVNRGDILELLKRNESVSQVLAKKVNETLELNGDKDFAIKVGPWRYRCNLYWCNNKRLSMVIRHQSETVPELSSLGLPQSYLDLMSHTKGLLLVTGATGSGKTTTLAATLEHLNETVAGHIITLEDPVEYLIQSKRCRVDQRQLGRDVHSFETGLRAALRQDPDILLVGELRDYATVKTALDAANTGHLVLGTLHTNSAQQSIERLVSFFDGERQDWAHAVLGQILLGIVSQTLVPLKNAPGRALASEILVCTHPEVKALIRERKTHQLFNLMDTGSGKGHHLLNKVLIRMVKENVIEPYAALQASYDVSALKKDFQRENIAIY